VTTQEVFVGPGSLKHIQEIIDRHQARRVLLVTGKGSYDKSGAKGALAPFLEGCDVVRFSDFTPNPKLEEALAGIELIQTERPDLVVAVGGGSVIDMGKLIVTMAAQEGIEARAMVMDQSLVRAKGLPFVAIPTTAGTGSEATHFAVVYINSVKYSLAHSYILPDYAIVDSRLTHNASTDTIASCSMDALTQAVESYWSVSSSDESRAYAARAIKMIVDVLEAVHGDDVEAKRIMAEAAYLSGKAINITKTTAPHAISYPITTHFNVPHGHAVALTLGKFFVLHADESNTILAEKRGRNYFRQVMADLYSMFGCDSAPECCRKWYEAMDRIGLQTDMRALGIKTETDVAMIEKSISLERLSNNPVRVSSEILRDLFLVPWRDFTSAGSRYTPI